ncbi:Wzz/FepE/Etk N-terminal domain-containing protein, partial [Cecembia rubra]|uniref:Wzz/FepE/Etk N-terminal domain-containing protein n=1 Tax=Cecembia rubra TaxID=1485585 RepID=UPI002715322F
MSDKTIKAFKDEIDLFAIGNAIWRKRRFITGVTFIFMIIGLTISIVIPNEYTATSTFIPQTSESGKPGGSLGGLASLAGINIGGLGSGAEIPPSLYPRIVSSVPFKKALLGAKVHVYGIDEPVSYQYYYEELHSIGFIGLVKKYTLGLPSLILKAIKRKNSDAVITKDDNLIRISEKEFEHFKRLEKQLFVSHNEKGGFVSISFTMPDPFMAAEMARFAEEILQ